MDLKHLKKFKDTLDQSYYDDGTQVIPDNEYDVIDGIVNMALDSDPKIKINAKAGKILLPVQLWSLNKIKEYKKPVDDVVIMDKLDGVSCLLYKNKAYTRGNGIYGHDITNMINTKYLERVKNIGDNAIRGELVIKKDKYIKYSKEFANTRTMVCSYISRNEYNDDIDFVAYELISLKGYDLKPSQQFLKLKQYGFQTVFNTDVLKGDDDTFKYVLKKRVDESPYDIDGIVVTYENVKRKSRELTSNPKYSFAYKQNVKGVPTKIIDIIWNVGKSGLYTPIIVVDPVEIAGTVIQKVSGYNKEYIMNRKIGKGSIVEVIKAGNVIPCISDVITESKDINFPSDCNDKGVLNIKNDDRIEVCKLTHFAKTLKIQGIGPAKAKEMIEHDITPMSIVTQGNIGDQFNTLKPSANNKKIIKSINEQLIAATPIDILTALSFFGVGVARAKITKEKLYEQENSVTLLNKWTSVWKPLISTSTSTCYQYKPVNNEPNHGYTELSCITGSRSKDVEALVINMGYVPKYNFVKNTKILFVVGEYKEDNKKIKEALKRGIKIECI